MLDAARRALLEEIFRAAVTAADPAVVTRSLLDGLAKPDPASRIRIFGFGKAVHGMASALLEWLGDDTNRVSGLLVGVDEHPPLHPGLEQLVGDHPIPGRASLRAAVRLEQLTAAVRPNDQLYVLISGGTTSLIGAPIGGVSERDYRERFESLLRSGLDIGAMNAIRKQISRWGDGRVARAVAPAAVQPLIISDVESNDPATVGSGPCSGDDLPHVALPRVAKHDVPVDAALSFARSRGFTVSRGTRLTGEASVCGRDIAKRLIADARRESSPAIVVSGGETTVTLSDDRGIGGRCQELALSAARELGAAGAPISLLAAGTDGRDGPTDAAGAIVDETTWASITESGRDPARDLARHDAYPALDAVGALLRTGHTGTNMMDLAIAIIGA